MTNPDFSDELTNRLGDAADAIDHGDGAAALVDVRATALRRTRRRRAIGGIAAVGALVASGAIVALLASDDRGDELILSAPATEPADTANATAAPDDTESTGDGSSTENPDTEPNTTAPVEEQPVATDAEVDAEVLAPTGGTFTVRGASIENLGDAPTADELQDGYPSQILAWNDGFLSIASISEPQTLPTELPPEISEQFPQEVLDLFPDGLPPTIGEATQILEEAGLYDVVAEIVLANPDVSDAIYAQPVNVMSIVRFSTDGENWEEIDAAIPSEVLQGQRVISTGDRIAAFGNEGESIVVRSSTDLLNWDEQSIPTPSRPVDRPDFISFEVYAGSFAANAGGWVADVSTFGEFNMSMLPDGPLYDEIRSGNAGYGFTEDGVEFTLGTGPDGQPLPPDEAETRVVTWEELGAEQVPDMRSLFTGTRFAGTWSGTPQDVSFPSREDGGQVYALQDGFVEFGGTVRFSADGIDWTELESPFQSYVSWAVETDDGFLVTAVDDLGRTAAFAHDLDEGTWTEVDLGDIPSQSSSENGSRGVALISDYGDPFGDLVAVHVTSGEADGYRFEQRSRSGDDPTVSYTVTEIATGEVVSSETLDGDDEFGSRFEFVEQTDGEDDVAGFRLIDPASGDVLVVIPYDEMTWSQLDENGAEISDEQLSGAFPQEDPATWVVAAVGDDLVVQQLDDGAAMRYPIGAARNGDIVIVGFGDGTFARIALS